MFHRRLGAKVSRGRSKEVSERNSDESNILVIVVNEASLSLHSSEKATRFDPSAEHESFPEEAE